MFLSNIKKYFKLSEEYRLLEHEFPCRRSSFEMVNT